MKRLLITMYHMYFFERTAYWLFAAGILITIGTQFGSPPTAGVGFIFGALFLAGFPLFWISVLFTFTISNRHLSVVPQWRQFFLGATFCLLFILSLYLSSAFFLFPKKMMVGINFFGIFITVFGTSSLVLFMMKHVLKNRFVPLILWLVSVTVYSSLKPYFSELPKLDSPLMLSIILLLTIAIWLRLTFWIKKVENIKNAFSSHLYTSQKHLSLFDRLTSKSIYPKQLSGFQTLMRGFMFENKSRWLLLLVIYIGFPFTAVTGLLLFTSAKFDEEWLLMPQLIGLIMLPFSSAEWLVRLRALWLKVSGGRHHFWLLWKKNLHTDLGFTFLILSIYCFLINLFFDVEPFFLAIYLFAIFIILPSACYFSTWMRLKGGIRSPLAVFLSIGYFLAIYASILTTLVLRIYTPLFLCGMFFIFIGLFSYIQVKNRFLSLDWVKNRPVNRVSTGMGWK